MCGGGAYLNVAEREMGGGEVLSQALECELHVRLHVGQPALNQATRLQGKRHTRTH